MRRGRRCDEMAPRAGADGAGGSGDELVGGVDHDQAGLLDPDPAAEQDPAPGLDAGYVRAPVEERGDLPGAVGDPAGEHAAVLHRPDLYAVDPALDRDLAVVGDGGDRRDARPHGGLAGPAAVPVRDRHPGLPDRLEVLACSSNGMIVATERGIRLTTRAILSAVWSCSSRPSTGA